VTNADRTIAHLLQSRHRRAPAAPGPGSGGVLIGLVGRGIQLSRSPRMHEREGARLGLHCAYVLIDFDALDLPDAALPDILQAAAQAGFAGLNVTHPFKQSVMAALGRFSAEAEAIGAVNTVVFDRTGPTGHNTDSFGFAASFRDGLPDARLERVVQFGAGGAGAAVAHALAELGAGEIVLVDSDVRRAEQLAARLSNASGTVLCAAAEAAPPIAVADGIVNATPVGMAKYPGTPFPPPLLQPRQWVADIVYFPRDTALLQAARALGCRTLPGTGMAVYQAVRAFELFTGIAPDPHAMVRHFEAAA
jgi:shikimate dehydrogenase